MGDEIETRILDSLEDAKRWRGRIERRFEGLEEKFSLLSHQVAELSTEVTLRAEHGIERHNDLMGRVSATEKALRGGGFGSAVDVTVTSGNQTMGAEAAQAPAVPGTVKVAAGSGTLASAATWLFSGGWDQIIAFFKGLGR